MQSTHSRRQFLAAGASAVSMSVLPGAARAQADSRPIRFIMPYAAGSGTDVVFRPYVDAIGRALQQPIVLDNRGGANGLIGMDLAAKSPPDGLTVTLGTASTMVINRFLYSKMPYDPVKDFDPVGSMFGTANLLTVRQSMGVSNVQELIAYARQNPGKLKVASGGVGTTGHLSAALFDSMAGTQMIHVPYKSSVDGFKDMIGGDIDLIFENVALSVTLAKDPRVKIMAVTSKARVASLPNVPTLSEAGLPGYEILAWAGLVVPKGTPAAAIQRLNAAMRKAINDPDANKITESFALIPIPSSPQEFAELIRVETPKWADLVKRTGAKLD